MDNNEAMVYLKMILMIQVNALALYILLDLERSKRWLNRRWLVRPINARRIYRGHFHTLFEELREDQDMFFKVTRMDVHTFDYLSDCLSTYLLKPRSNILPRERLAITLR